MIKKAETYKIEFTQKQVDLLIHIIDFNLMDLGIEDTEFDIDEAKKLAIHVLNYAHYDGLTKHEADLVYDRK